MTTTLTKIDLIKFGVNVSTNVTWVWICWEKTPKNCLLIQMKKNSLILGHFGKKLGSILAIKEISLTKSC